MDTDQQGGVDDRLVVAAGGEEDDRISGLPDEHLHSILLLLESTTDAACTSVLSRRWRHVWTHLPELSFRYEYREKDSRSPSPDVDPELSTLDDGDTPVSPSPPPDPSSLLHDFDTLVSGSLEDHFCIRSSHAAARLVKLVLLRHDKNDDDDPVVSDAATATVRDCIGDALAVYSAPTLRRLDITASSVALPHVTADDVSSWLRFASHRLAGDLHLSVLHFQANGDIMLPVCERVTSMGFQLDSSTLRFYLPPQLGAFEALASLSIREAIVDSCELETMLSSRCPRLKELKLEIINFKDDARRSLSVCSGSLEQLQILYIRYHEGLLQVAAPMLRTLRCGDQCDFYIAAPKLSELCWDNGKYDPTRHHIAEEGHTLRRLEIIKDAGMVGSKLMQQFNSVHQLYLNITIDDGTEGYKRYMEDINKLPRCEVLVVSMGKNHALRSTMISLLRKCSRVRKLVLQLSSNRNDCDPCNWGSGCPCSLLENRKAANIVLGSLEEVEVKGTGDADHKVEVVRLLCSCSIMFQKRVVITVSQDKLAEYIRTKVSRIGRPNKKVEVIVRS